MLIKTFLCLTFVGRFFQVMLCYIFFLNVFEQDNSDFSDFISKVEDLITVTQILTTKIVNLDNSMDQISLIKNIIFSQTLASCLKYNTYCYKSISIKAAVCYQAAS